MADIAKETWSTVNYLRNKLSSSNIISTTPESLNNDFVYLQTLLLVYSHLRYDILFWVTFPPTQFKRIFKLQIRVGLD